MDKINDEPEYQYIVHELIKNYILNVSILV